jgi:hypothetical protein
MDTSIAHLVITRIPSRRSFVLHQSLSQSVCVRCQAIKKTKREMTVDENPRSTESCSVSSLNRLDCGLCQVMTIAFEKLAAWERPEYRNDSPIRNPHVIRIKYGSESLRS